MSNLSSNLQNLIVEIKSNHTVQEVEAFLVSIGGKVEKVAGNVVHVVVGSLFVNHLKNHAAVSSVSVSTPVKVQTPTPAPVVTPTPASAPVAAQTTAAPVVEAPSPAPTPEVVVPNPQTAPIPTVVAPSGSNS